jgi:hypothetical protein
MPDFVHFWANFCVVRVGEIHYFCVCSKAERPLLFLHLVEIALAKLVPSCGRGVRPPEQLTEPLRQLSNAVVSADCLTEENMQDIIALQLALYDVSEATDPEVVASTTRALEKLDMQSVAASSILYPIVRVAAFKAVMTRASEEAAAQMKTLTKSRVVKLTRDALAAIGNISEVEVDLAIVAEFRAIFARATTYINTLKPKHQDRSSYSQIIGQLLDMVAEGVRQVDEALPSSGDDDTMVNEILGKVSKIIKHMGFQKNDFGPESAQFVTWKNYEASCPSRGDIVKRLAVLKSKTDSAEKKVQAVAELKDLMAKQEVPLSEAAANKISQVLVDANVDDLAKPECEKAIRGLINDTFSAEGGIAVPSASRILQVLKWTPWCPTPNFTKDCLNAAPALAFFMKHHEDVDKWLAKKDIELDDFHIETYNYSKPLEAMGPEATYQMMEFLLKQTSHDIKASATLVDKAVSCARGKVKEMLDVKSGGVSGDLLKLQKVA